MGWQIGEVIDETFKVFGKNWVTLVVGNLVASAIAAAPMLLWTAITIPAMIAKASAGEGGQSMELAVGGAVGTMAAAGVSTLVLFILFAPALSRIALAAVRGENPRIGDVFNFRRAGVFLGAGLLTGLAVMGGFLLLVVPGIIAALGLAFVSFFVVDERNPKGVTDAMEASWHAARGSKARLFGLTLIFMLVSLVIQTIAGLSVFLFPLSLALALVQTPITMIGLAVIYTKINPQQSGAQQLAA